MDTATASPSSSSAEPISRLPGEQRLGAGGYGEVWRAEAPGGIAKAIKIVYGFHEDERATRELNRAEPH